MKVNEQTLTVATGYALATYYATKEFTATEEESKNNAVWGALEVLKIPPLARYYCALLVGLEQQIKGLEDVNG
jgi:hypothetical protein